MRIVLPGADRGLWIALSLAWAIAALLPIAAAAPAPSGTPPAMTPLPLPVEGEELTQIGPDYYTFRWHGARDIFLVTSAGVIATDPISNEGAKALRAAIRTVTNLPVRYVVYSHQHWDHIAGGGIFRDEGAHFVSHANCLAHFRDLPNPDIVMPDITFTGPRYDLKLGNHVLVLRYLGLNHGDCLIVMTPDNVNVPFIVDLATAGGMPYPIMADYSLHNWVRSLRELESWDFKEYVGGHGIPLAPRSRITERREYLEALITETKRELDAGTPQPKIPDVVAARLEPQFHDLRRFDDVVRDNVRRVLTYYEMGW